MLEQDWSYLDGAYFCFISLMTIGFGDFVPGKSYIYNIDDNVEETEANAKLVLGAVYILLGMGIIGKDPFNFHLLFNELVY